MLMLRSLTVSDTVIVSALEAGEEEDMMKREEEEE